MKKNITILLIAASILIVSLVPGFTETIEVKDYIKGKFPTIFNIYLASLGELDQEEKEFIDLLQNLPEEEQKYFAKEVYENGFSKETLENCRESIIAKEEKPNPEIKEKTIDTGKWVYGKGTNPLNDKVVITFKLECEKNESEEPIFLILEKEGKKAIIYIDWGVEVRTVYRGSVIARTRFGDKEATKSMNWATSIVTFGDLLKEEIFGKPSWIESNYTFYSGGESKFIRELMDVDRFIIEIQMTDKMKIIAEFDVRGLKDAVEQFNDILQWMEE